MNAGNVKYSHRVPHILALVGSFMLTGSSLSAQALDDFGGCKDIKGTCTGRWHAGMIGERHWFVTPEGYAMNVLGINHIQDGSEQQKKRAIDNLHSWHYNCGGYDPLRTLLKQGLQDLEGNPHGILTDQVSRTSESVLKKLYKQ